MKIAVILPPPVKTPKGGYKIIYHYCDLLISKKTSISIDIYYDIKLANKKYNPIRNYIKKIYYQTVAKEFYTWFEFINKKKINHIIGTKIFYQKKDKYDVLIATSIETAQYVNKICFPKTVLYFIQGFEEWSRPKDEVIESYHYGFKNIVVSQWLNDILEKNNAEVALKLLNPVDELFSITIPLEDRPVKSVLFMYHPEIWKGSKEAIGVMGKLYNFDASIKIACFSAFEKPKEFPLWINFVQTPTRGELKDLMNEYFIFLSSSYTEGYGLPPAEAMACGCCVVTTDSGGVGDFAIDYETAYVVSSPPDINEITNVIKGIFLHPEQASVLARNGNEIIKNINWNQNIRKLIEIIK